VETREEIGDGKMIAGRYVQALLNGELNGKKQ
jgi:hypothetical protein